MQETMMPIYEIIAANNLGLRADPGKLVLHYSQTYSTQQRREMQFSTAPTQRI